MEAEALVDTLADKLADAKSRHLATHLAKRRPRLWSTPLLADTFAEAKTKTLVNMLVDMTSKAVLDTLAASLLEAKGVTLPHWGGGEGDALVKTLADTVGEVRTEKVGTGRCEG